MKELIIKVTDSSDDAEVLTYDAATGRWYFKKTEVKNVLEAIESTIRENEKSKEGTREKLRLLHPDIIAINKNGVAIRQEGKRKIVTYGERAFNINFPNAIYIIHFERNKVLEIKAFTYKTWKGENTKLFSYAMPNMLGANRICIGSAPTKIEGEDYVKALENIIFTRYSHNWVDGIKSFRDTIPYFEYLEKNDFPYDLIFDLKKELKEVL